MKNYLYIGSCLLLLSCSTTTITLPQNISHISSSTPIGCRYEKQFSDDQAGKNSSSAWYFWRDGHKVEMRDALSNQAEVWEKDKNGKLTYSRLFFNEGIALDFTPGDLAALNLNPSWDELNFIIQRDEFGKSLKLTSKDQDQNAIIEHYQGKLKGQMAELDWLPSLQLPARIEKKQDHGKFTLVLAQCGEANLSGLQPSSKPLSGSLRHIDFTDLGDMEDDPAVKKLEGLIGAHHDHD